MSILKSRRVSGGVPEEPVEDPRTSFLSFLGYMKGTEGVNFPITMEIFMKNPMEANEIISFNKSCFSKRI